MQSIVRIRRAVAGFRKPARVVFSRSRPTAAATSVVCRYTPPHEFGFPFTRAAAAASAGFATSSLPANAPSFGAGGGGGRPQHAQHPQHPQHPHHPQHPAAGMRVNFNPAAAAAAAAATAGIPLQPTIAGLTASTGNGGNGGGPHISSTVSSVSKLKRDVAVFKFDSSGNYTPAIFSLAQLKDMSAVAARDLLVLESGGRIRSAPTILPRRKCILMNVSHVKAIIYSDFVLVLDVHRPVVQNFAEHMKAALKASSNSDETQYFEFRVIECVLKFVCQKYSRRMSCFHPVIHNVTRSMNPDDIDTSALHRLLPLKNSLAALERATTELLGAITAILKSDEDMLDMFLTEKARRGGELPPREAHAELELLLENYHRDVSTLTQEAEYLRKTIQSGQDMMNMALDTYRNRMVRINAQMAMATVGLGTGVSLFSLFGMNLTSGLEAHPYMFWAVAGGGYGLAAVAWLYLHRNLARPRRVRGVGVREMAGVRATMNKLGDIQDIVLLSIGETSKLNKPEFRALLERASNRPLSGDEMDGIFRVYDSNDDGVMETDEIKSMLADAYSLQFSSFDSNQYRGYRHRGDDPRNDEPSFRRSS